MLFHCPELSTSPRGTSPGLWLGLASSIRGLARSLRGNAFGLTVAVAIVFGDATLAQSGNPVRKRADKVPVVLGQAWLFPIGGSPSQFPTIQAAVDAASEGDTVRLTDGLFRGPGNRDILVTGKDVRIESANGPANCVIDCERKGRAFLFTGPEVTAETIVRGLTILRGVGLDLGGGGGVLVWLGSLATIEDCVIVECSSQLGGGIAYYHSPEALGVIRDCVIFGCSSEDGGGIRGYNVLIDRCTIVENTASEMGAGIYLRQNSIVRDSLIVRNAVISNSPNGGGGLLARELVRVESCTIVDNTARFGGGIITAFGPGVVVSNCILWGNRALNSSQGDQVWSEFSFAFPDIVLRYCDIEGGAAGVGGFPNPMIELIATLDVDPEFADRANGDYHLTGASPLIGAGDPELAVQPFEGDHDGEPRANGALDMGADELYTGLALAYPSPGRAGEPNTLHARGAPPGAFVLFYLGFQPGAQALGFESCPDLALQVEDGTLLAIAKADAQGMAQVRDYAPTALAGQTLLLQTLAFDPSSAALTCTRSNLVTFGFP